MIVVEEPGWASALSKIRAPLLLSPSPQAPNYPVMEIEDSDDGDEDKPPILHEPKSRNDDEKTLANSMLCLGNGSMERSKCANQASEGF